MNPPKPEHEGAAPPKPWIHYAAGLFIGIYAFIIGLYTLLFLSGPG